MKFNAHALERLEENITKIKNGTYEAPENNFQYQGLRVNNYGSVYIVDERIDGKHYTNKQISRMIARRR